MSFRRWEGLTSIGSVLCSIEAICLQVISWCMREWLGESELVESVYSSEHALSID